MTGNWLLSIVFLVLGGIINLGIKVTRAQLCHLGRKKIKGGGKNEELAFGIECLPKKEGNERDRKREAGWVIYTCGHRVRPVGPLLNLTMIGYCTNWPADFRPLDRVCAGPSSRFCCLFGPRQDANSRRYHYECSV